MSDQKRGRWDPRSETHPFKPVAGHFDDDECTFRSDGTDDTYCGQPEHRHETSER